MMQGDGEKERRWCEVKKGRRDKEEDEKIRVPKKLVIRGKRSHNWG